jgi:GGDEF domain-containing protein
VLDQAEKQLASRMDGMVSDVKHEWAARFVESLREVNDTEIIRALKDRQGNEKDAYLLREPLTAMLTKKGYTQERIAELFEKAKSTSGKIQYALPKGVLNASATLYFLEHEIKRHQRYNTPFSTLIVTIERTQGANGELRLVGVEEENKIMPQVLMYLRRVLRDLDIVGSLGFVSRDIPFVVLPMTDGHGAEKVVARLDHELAKNIFECGKERVKGVFALSHTSFDKTVMSGYRSFLEIALDRHKKREEQLRTERGMREKENGGERI